MRKSDVQMAATMLSRLEELERLDNILKPDNVIVWAAPSGKEAEIVQPCYSKEFKDEFLMLLSREMLRIEKRLHEMGVER